MPRQTPQLFLLAYDIANPQRLTRVHRRLKAWGIPLQYSVWLVPGRRRDMEQLCTELDALIVAAEDDIRVYGVPARPLVVRRGCARFKGGINLIGDRRLDHALSAFLGEEAEPDAEVPAAG